MPKTRGRCLRRCGKRRYKAAADSGSIKQRQHKAMVSSGGIKLRKAMTIESVEDMTKIKVCGLYREEDIEAVNEALPDYCGFIIHFPKSHRNISPERVRELTVKLSDAVCRVGVIVDQPVGFAAELLNSGTVDIVQLHGAEDEAYIRELRHLTAASGGKIWKAFKIRCKEDVARANASSADMVVLDNGYGTGQVFDWSLIDADGAGIRTGKFLLAGGLTPENIPDAVRQIHPWGIDISSGVETDKKKDRDKIMAAVKACRSIKE